MKALIILLGIILLFAVIIFFTKKRKGSVNDKAGNYWGKNNHEMQKQE